MPFISIIMPVYNASDTLDRAIGSILKQTIDDWELVCVDDGSTDNSLEIIRRYSQSDSRIRFFHKGNSGPGPTRNFGIEKSCGDYIAFLDSDDKWNPECVEKIHRMVLTKAYDVIFLGTVSCAGKKEKNVYNVDRFKKFTRKDILSCVMSGLIPWGQEKVIKASIVKDNNLCFSSDLVGEEALFSFDVLRLSNWIGFIEGPMYYYFYNDKGQHKKGGFDPWRLVVDNMRGHLDRLKLLNEYEESLNSFALRSFCISVYRMSVKSNYLRAKKAVYENLDSYSKNYDFQKLLTISIDKKSLFLYKLIRFRLFFVAYALANIRARN